MCSWIHGHGPTPISLVVHLMRFFILIRVIFRAGSLARNKHPISRGSRLFHVSWKWYNLFHHYNYHVVWMAVRLTAYSIAKNVLFTLVILYARQLRTFEYISSENESHLFRFLAFFAEFSSIGRFIWKTSSSMDSTWITRLRVGDSQEIKSLKDPFNNSHSIFCRIQIAGLGNIGIRFG